MEQAIMTVDEFLEKYKDHNDYEALIFFCQIHAQWSTLEDPELSILYSVKNDTFEISKYERSEDWARRVVTNNDEFFVRLRDLILYREAIPNGIVVDDTTEHSEEIDWDLVFNERG